MSKEAKILTAILVVVVGGLIGIFALLNHEEPAPVGDKTKIIRDNSHKQGTGNIQMVEFGDIQCPACGATHPAVKQLLKDYDGKITFYFRNFPLSMHPLAQDAAEAAEAAGDQGKYWEMHDKLYESQKDWGDLTTNLSAGDALTKWVGYAKDLGLDGDKLKQAVEDKKFKSVIDQDTADGTAMNIQGTPTFYFNGEAYTGKTDYASLRDKVEALLAAKK